MIKELDRIINRAQNFDSVELYLKNIPFISPPNEL